MKEPMWDDCIELLLVRIMNSHHIFVALACYFKTKVKYDTEKTLHRETINTVYFLSSCVVFKNSFRSMFLISFNILPKQNFIATIFLYIKTLLHNSYIAIYQKWSKYCKVSYIRKVSFKDTHNKSAYIY